MDRRRVQESYHLGPLGRPRGEGNRKKDQPVKKVRTSDDGIIATAGVIGTLVLMVRRAVSG